MKNILITGANGQLGNCLRDLAADYQDKYNFYYTDVAELDITRCGGHREIRCGQRH